MTGHRVTLPKGTKIDGGKVKPKVSGYRAKQKKMQAQRTEGRWLRKARKT